MTSVSSPAPSTVSQVRVRSGRTLELVLLLLAVAIVALAYAQVNIAVDGVLPRDTWSHVGIYAAIVLGLHLVLRWRARYADPLRLPIAALLTGLGLGAQALQLPRAASTLGCGVPGRGLGGQQQGIVLQHGTGHDPGTLARSGFERLLVRTGRTRPDGLQARRGLGPQRAIVLLVLGDQRRAVRRVELRVAHPRRQGRRAAGRLRSELGDFPARGIPPAAGLPLIDHGQSVGHQPGHMP